MMFDVSQKLRDRVPPSAQQVYCRLHWACPVGLCDACCAGWVGGVSCIVVHQLFLAGWYWLVRLEIKGINSLLFGSWTFPHFTDRLSATSMAVKFFLAKHFVCATYLTDFFCGDSFGSLCICLSS